MLIRKLLSSVLISAALVGTAAIPVTQASAAEIWLKQAPPENRREAVPAPRRGYVWAPGHWQWNTARNRHVWKAGNWERARPGYAFQGPQWVERDGRWFYQARRWDRDGDGIPNNRDSTPDGARMPADRDRDGVPNRRDAQPNNPNRS